MNEICKQIHILRKYADVYVIQYSTYVRKTFLMQDFAPNSVKNFPFYFYIVNEKASALLVPG
jgi:hypothetical protein